MGLLGLLVDVVTLPLSVADDVKNLIGGPYEPDATKENLEDIAEDIADILL